MPGDRRQPHVPGGDEHLQAAHHVDGYEQDPFFPAVEDVLLRGGARIGVGVAVSPNGAVRLQGERDGQFVCSSSRSFLSVRCRFASCVSDLRQDVQEGEGIFVEQVVEEHLGREALKGIERFEVAVFPP